MRIYTDANGAYVNAISKLGDGTDVEGHLYHLTFGQAGSQVHFQQGPIKEHGVNGPTNEALLEILLHRTKFLDSQYPSDFNKRAIKGMQEALDAFNERTAERTARNVEGTHQA